jgi:hypothetical protein
MSGVDSHDRFVRTRKLVQLLDIDARQFSSRLRPALMASPHVRVIATNPETGRGRRWHLGDVVAFMRTRHRPPYQPPPEPGHTPYVAPVGSRDW